MEEKSVWYLVFDGEKMVQETRDKAKAERRVFAENSSYRKQTDKTWHIKVREDA